MLDDLPFAEVWACDFEFKADAGERPVVHCLCALEVRTGREVRLWINELRHLKSAPFPVGPQSLFIAFFTTAEFSCFLQLDWQLPERILDLYVEFRTATNGLELPCGRGLLGALQFYGLPHLDADEKGEMRSLAMRGGPYRPEERQALLDYCRTDVVALRALLPPLWQDIRTRRGGPYIALGQALLRGRAMAATARMEHTGTPIDTDSLAAIRSGWGSLKSQLIEQVDEHYGVYEDGHFRKARFRDYLRTHGIPWPELDDGSPALDSGTFRDMTKSWPQLRPLHELRHALGELRLEELAVGADNRNRTLIGPFSTRTGRNAPSNTRFIFGPATWIRSLIKPGPGQAIAYCDFSSQEIGIAAALSGDEALLEAYRTGDVYLAFAIQAGLAPEGATKATHGLIRDRCKVAVLGTLYGMGAEVLARKLGCRLIEARDLLRLHRQSYPRFWAWIDDVVSSAYARRYISTAFGWAYRPPIEAKPCSLQNWQMQSHGSEMLRLACCLGTEAGIRVCAPVHDALLIEAPVDQIEAEVAKLQGFMAEASRIVLADKLTIGSDAKIVRWPDRYSDPRGVVMWETVTRLVAELAAESASAAA